MTRPTVGMFLLAGCLLGGTAAAQPDLLNDGSEGALELEGERTLFVRDLTGIVRVRIGERGRLQYQAVAESNKGEALPVDFWLDDGVLELRAPEGDARRRQLLIVVDPDMDVVVEMSDSEVRASGLRGTLSLRGNDLDVTARGLFGDVDAELNGGQARFETLQGELKVRGGGLSLTGRQLEQRVRLDLEDAGVALAGLAGELDAILVGSTLKVEGLDARAEVDATEGRVELADLTEGGEIECAGATLELIRVKGMFRIRTDAEVQFRDSEAELHIDSFGGMVRGKGNKGLVEALSQRSRVVLEAIEGEVRVAGDGVETDLKQVNGKVYVKVNGSNVLLEKIAGSTLIEIEFGDVEIAGIQQDLQVVSRDGNVRVRGASAPVSVEADGEWVEVGFSSLPSEDDSTLTNARGDVTVFLPKQGSCRIDAQAKYGRVESDHPDIRVSNDESFASGIINRGSRAELKVEAGGDIFFISQ